MAKLKKKSRRRFLTDEEKEVRAKRLEKARASKAPTQHLSIHPDVPREDTATLGLKNVRSWIRTNKEEVAALKLQMKRDPSDKVSRARFHDLDTYVHNLQSYLRSGVYLDHRYGMNMVGRLKRICRVMAHHWQPNDPHYGMIQREVDVYYPDVGLWTQDMHNEYYDIKPSEKVEAPKKKRRKRKKTK